MGQVTGLQRGHRAAFLANGCGLLRGFGPPGRGQGGQGYGVRSLGVRMSGGHDVPEEAMTGGFSVDGYAVVPVRRLAVRSGSWMKKMPVTGAPWMPSGVSMMTPPRPSRCRR